MIVSERLIGDNGLWREFVESGECLLFGGASENGDARFPTFPSLECLLER